MAELTAEQRLAKKLAGYEWRYTSRGRVVHAIRRSSEVIGRCGMGPGWLSSEWLGTGSQDEYDRAAELPKCKRCVDLIKGSG